MKKIFEFLKNHQVSLSLWFIFILSSYISYLGLHRPSLYVDELWRLNSFSESSIVDGFQSLVSPQSPGYFLFYHFWVKISHLEFWVKLPSALAYIASALLLFLIVRKQMKSWALAILAGAIFAACPIVIEYSRYVKPYTLEIFAHCLLLYLTLIYRENPNRRLLIAILSLSTVLTYFAFVTLFILPGLYLYFFWLEVGVRPTAKINIYLLFTFGFITLVGVGFQYWFFHQLFPPEWFNPDKLLLAKDYPYGFYMSESGKNVFVWIFDGFRELSSLFHDRNLFGDILSKVFEKLGISFTFNFSNALFYFFTIGLVRALFKKDFYMLLLVYLSCFVFTLSGLLGFYMLGPIRTNLFFSAYLFLGFTYAVEGGLIVAQDLNEKIFRSRISPMFIKSWVVLLALFFFTRDFTALNTVHSRQEGFLALQQLMNFAKTRKNFNDSIALVTNYQSKHDLKYYLTFHDTGKEWKTDFERIFVLNTQVKPTPEGFSEVVDSAMVNSKTVCTFLAWYDDYAEKIVRENLALSHDQVLDATYANSLAQCWERR